MELKQNIRIAPDSVWCDRPDGIGKPPTLCLKVPTWRDLPLSYAVIFQTLPLPTRCLKVPICRETTDVDLKQKIRIAPDFIV